MEYHDFIVTISVTLLLVVLKYQYHTKTAVHCHLCIGDSHSLE